MRIYIQAFLATLGVALVLIGLFSLWRERSAVNHGANQVSLLDTLEKQGMLDFEAIAISGVAGEVVKLSDFEGKKIILNFWASWCGPCVDEMPSMIEMIEKLKGEIVVIAISADSSRESIVDFLKLFPKLENNKLFVIGWDKDLNIGRLYQADRLPESYVIGSDFKLARKVSGSIKWDTTEAIEYLRSLK